MTWVLLTAVVGCGDEVETPFGEGENEPDPFDEYDPAELSPGNAVAFAGASAPAMFAVGLAPMIVVGVVDDPSCPTVTENGTTTVHEGGCTNSDGTKVFGKAIVEEPPEGGGSIRYEGFGYGTTEPCNTVEVDESFIYNGSMVVTVPQEGEGTFDLDMTLEFTAADEQSCATVTGTGAYDYGGSYSGEPTPDGDLDLDQSSTWNGSGRLGFELYGFIEASTEDEVLDNSVCDTEALSGSTTIESGGDVVEVRYDGASDCEMESTAQWSFNGDPQGELTGVRCTFAPGPRGSSGWLLAGMLVLCRRRRQT